MASQKRIFDSLTKTYVQCNHYCDTACAETRNEAEKMLKEMKLTFDLSFLFLCSHQMRFIVQFLKSKYS